MNICHTYGLALFFVFFNFFANAQQPFDCNGRMFRVLEEQGGSNLQEIIIDQQTGVPTFIDLHFFHGLRINGIAYRPADNFIYGVLLENPYALIRIDANYELERLAELPLPISMLFVSGDVSPDEKYLVQLGYSPNEDGNLLALIDLESDEYTTSIIPAAKTNPDVPVQAADIAFHPTLNKLFGFDHTEGRLISIDVENALIDNTTYPMMESIQGNMPSIFFDAYGKLYGIAAEQNIYTNRNFYQFDSGNGNAELIEEMGFERNQDACSCPYKVKLLNRVSSRHAYPCTNLEFEMTLINRTDRTQQGVILTDTFPIGTTINNVGDLPFNGTIVSGEGSRILEIHSIDLPVGKFKFSLNIEIDENVNPMEVENQAFLDNIYLNSLTQTTRIFSDDPETVEADDPTFFSIKPLNISFGNIAPVICPDDTLWINTGIYGAENYHWNNGNNTHSIFVTEPGEYSVTVTSGCNEVSNSIEVREEKIELELGNDQSVEKGETIKIIPSVFSNGIIKTYRWEESSQNTLNCYTCTSAIAQPMKNTTYKLEVENEWGCQASDSIYVDVSDYKLYVPNAFSPNGDAVNDIFFPYSHYLYRVEFFRIFDRWGDLMFEANDFFSNDSNMGWDGTYNGKILDPAVLVWVAKFQSLDGREHIAEGEVHLIK